MSKPSDRMEEQLKDMKQKAASREAGDTHAVIALNLQALGERGDKLGDLQTRSTQQTAQAQEMARSARALTRKLEEENAALDQVVDTLTAGPVRRAAADVVVGAVRMLSPRRAGPDNEKSVKATSAVPAGEVVEDAKESDKKERKPKKEKKEKKEKKAKQREAVVNPSESGSSETEMSPSRKDKKEKRKHKKKDKKNKIEKATTAVLSGGESASGVKDTERKPNLVLGTIKAKGQQVLNAISPRKKTDEPASDDDVTARREKPKLQRTDTNFAAIRSDDEITTHKRPSVKATNSEAKKLEAAAADAFPKGRNGSGKNFMGGSPRTGIPRSVSFDASANPSTPSPRAKGSTTGARIAGRQAPEGQLSPSAVSLPPAAPSVADFRSAHDLSRPPLPPSGYNDTPPLSSLTSASRVEVSVGSGGAALASTTPRQPGSGKQLAGQYLKASDDAVAARRATAQQTMAQPPLLSSDGGNRATAPAQPPKTKQVEPKVIPPKRNYWNLIAGFVIGVLALGAFAAGFALTYTGLLTPLGIAMIYGGIWLASSAAGLAGFALTIAAGLILKEVAHLAYDYFFVDEEDKIVISSPRPSPAMTKLHEQGATKKATKGSDETFCYGMFNWLSRAKTKVPAAPTPEDQQRLIDGKEQTQTQSLC